MSWRRQMADPTTRRRRPSDRLPQAVDHKFQSSGERSAFWFESDCSPALVLSPHQIEKMKRHRTSSPGKGRQRVDALARQPIGVRSPTGVLPWTVRPEALAVRRLKSHAFWLAFGLGLLLVVGARCGQAQPPADQLEPVVRLPASVFAVPQQQPAPTASPGGQRAPHGLARGSSVAPAQGLGSGVPSAAELQQQQQRQTFTAPQRQTQPAREKPPTPTGRPNGESEPTFQSANGPATSPTFRPLSRSRQDSSASDATAQRTDPDTTPLPRPSRTVGLLLENRGRNSSRTADERGAVSSNTTGLAAVWKTLAALTAVVVLVLVAGRLLKKHSPLVVPRLSDEAVALLGRRSIDREHSIHLVRCGTRILVLGLAPGEIRTLAEITDPVEVDVLAGLCRSEQTPTGQFLHQVASVLKTGSSATAAARQTASAAQQPAVSPSRPSGVPTPATAAPTPVPSQTAALTNTSIRANTA